MSRRIAVFAFAAGTALMIGPVSADQECFDSTCIQPPAVDAPVEAVRAPVETTRVPDEIAHAPAEIVRAPAEIVRAPVDTIAMPDDVASARAAAGNDKPDVLTSGSAKVPTATATRDFAKDLPKELPENLPQDLAKAAPKDPPKALSKEAAEAPLRDLPAEARMPVVETPPKPVVARKLPPEPRIYPRSTPEFEHAPQRAAQPAPPRPVPPAPQYAHESDVQVRAQDAAAAPVRVVNPRVRARTEEASAIQTPAYAPAYVAAAAPSYRRGNSANVIVVAPPVADDGSIAAYPAVRPDPNWRLCQIDQRTGRHTYCTAQSYHPYGEGGYRPMGTYRAYGTAPGYVTTQPDARIISLDQDD